jgi:tetratricopeptide (TPR) repeat protein
MKKKLKIAVYAICKNEEKFVEKWYNSMKEADKIFVLDTGSTDNTVKLLKSHNINVRKKRIKPWRFDVARNESLKMIPKDYDVCVCTDLDEVFNKNWRKEIEEKWKENTNRLRYIYNWSLDEYNNPKVSFYYEKIHSRNGYKWIYPVHEILEFDKKIENVETTDKIILNHYPDQNKSRDSYLPLLEISVKENPYNDRNMHYLGREYMYQGMWEKAISTLQKHINLNSSTWIDERSASMRFIARCYQELGNNEDAKKWLDKAIEETPYLRDPYVERALLEYKLSNWEEIKKYCLKALTITSHQKTYINEVFSWDETIYDLLSLSYYYTEDLPNSLININKALEINPNNQRIINNKKIIEEKLSK